MRRGFWRGRDGEHGQAVVLIAMTMTGLLLATGLAIDTGRLFVARRDAQAAADAAAWAGAVAIRNGSTSANVIAAATADATENGYTNGGDVTVTVSHPPTGGTYVGNSLYIEVKITLQVRTTLMPATVSTVNARAVGGAAPVDQGYAVIALDTASTPGVVSTSNQGTIAVNNGGIMINSSSTTAGDNDGIVSISPAPPYGTDVVGGVSGTWPNVRTGAQPLPDPYANFPKPDVTGMTVRSATCCALQPGQYSEDIDDNADWTMAPGIYVLKGAGINLEGNSSSLNGTGITIFITTSTYPVSGGTCADHAGKTVKLNGGNATSISAPTDSTGTWFANSASTYKGMLVYQDPACTGEISVGGGAAITGVGTIYAPSASVVGNGNGSDIAVTQVVAKKVDSQNADFTFNYSNGSTAQPRIPALSE